LVGDPKRASSSHALGSLSKRLSSDISASCATSRYDSLVSQDTPLENGASMLVLAKKRPVDFIETDSRSARLLPLAVGMLALRLMSPTSFSSHLQTLWLTEFLLDCNAPLGVYDGRLFQVSQAISLRRPPKFSNRKLRICKGHDRTSHW
jgi:hypothetical protein